jgi:hypothetical protein
MIRVLKRMKTITAIALIAMGCIAIGCSKSTKEEALPATEEAATEEIVEKVVVMKYDLPIENFAVTYDTIKPKQTIADLLYGLGFNANQIYKLTQCPDTVFNVRKIRPGQACALLSEKDSAATPRYFIYEESPKSYITFDIADNYRAERKHKPVEWRESEVAGTVKSSLWFAMEENGASPLLAVEMSHIF